MYLEVGVPLIEYVTGELPGVFPIWLIWFMPAVVLLLGVACDLMSWQPNQFKKQNPYEDQVQAIWGGDQFITPDVDVPEDTIVLDQDEMPLVLLRGQPMTMWERHTEELQAEQYPTTSIVPVPGHPNYYRWLVGQQAMHLLADMEEEMWWDADPHIHRMMWS